MKQGQLILIDLIKTSTLPINSGKFPQIVPQRQWTLAEFVTQYRDFIIVNTNVVGVITARDLPELPVHLIFVEEIYEIPKPTKIQLTLEQQLCLINNKLLDQPNVVE